MLSFINTIAGRIAIGVGIALLALVAFLSFRLDRAETKITAQEATIAQTIAANASQSETIEALRGRIERDGAILRGLGEIQARLAADANRRRDDLDRLAEENPDVANFLDMPIPERLRSAPSGDADGDSPDQD